MESEGPEDWGGGAGAVLGLTAGTSISIRYHSSFGSHDDILLLEVDEKLLPDFLQNRVDIRGQPDEDAVLCTPTATYAMKFVSTSNSVLLIPPGDPTCPTSNVVSHEASREPSASVIKVAPGSIELTQAAPRLDKLKTLLNERLYMLEEDLENEPRFKTGLYRWQDLVEQIQASNEELRVGLRSLSAVEIDGYWRIVDDKSMDEILNMILNYSTLHEWPLHALEEDSVVSVLEVDGFPRRLVIHCLNKFGSKVENPGAGSWSLDEKRVCLQFAKRILNKGKMKLDSFMERWKRSIPSRMAADLSILEGEVLYEKTGIENWIHAFSISALPSTPAARFSALFRERAKWGWRDLEPYIRDLRVPGITAEGLLIKYTRKTQPSADVEPIFSAR